MHPISVLSGRQGFKLGVCSAAPVGNPYSLLGLNNNCAFSAPLKAMTERFTKLYKRR